VRRPSLVTIALVPVLLGLMGNLVMGTVEVPDWARLWVWTATALLVVAAVGIEVRRARSIGSAGPPGIGVDEAAEQLAVAVRTQWRQEEERLRVQSPYPLPVRWDTAHEALMDQWANICRAPAGTSAGALELAGQLDRIVEIYRRIPSGRMVILGRAGSGKTVLALRFALDLLDAPTTTHPVPVIFNLGSWNPGTTSLRDWLCDRLIRNHPGLATPDPKRHNPRRRPGQHRPHSAHPGRLRRDRQRAAPQSVDRVEHRHHHATAAHQPPAGVPHRGNGQRRANRRGRC
jgi:hypothetical protein